MVKKLGFYQPRFRLPFKRLTNWTVRSRRITNVIAVIEAASAAAEDQK